MEPSWHSPPLQPPEGSNLPSDLPKIPQLRHPALSQSWWTLLEFVAQIRGFKVPPRLGAQGQGGHSQRNTKEGRVVLAAPSAAAHLAPKNLPGMGQCLSSTGGTRPSLRGLGEIWCCWYFSRQGHVSNWSRSSRELQEPPDHVPVMPVEKLFPWRSSSCTRQDGSFQSSHRLHALQSSSRNDALMLLMRTVCSSLLHPGGDLSPLPTPSSTPPPNSC